MIDDLGSYPTYKESGVPWLGRVPAGWHIVRNGRLFAQRNETGFAHLPILEVSLKTGVRVRNFETAARKQVMSDFAKYKRSAKGDLAYNMMRMWQGAIGVVPVDGLVSPAYVVARPYPETIAPYYAYLFRTDDYMHEVDTYSHGIVKDRNRLYWDQFKQMPSPCPPPAEQSAIVRFLDHADRRIRRYVSAKRRLIGLLNEQKQAVIHRAVTRGLDPDARMKPSGVEWLGDVPEKWEVRRLRHVLDMRVSNVDKHSVEGEMPVRLCNYVDVYKNDVISADMPFMKATAMPQEVERFRLRIGDVLITKDSEDWKDIGVPAYVNCEAPDLVCGYHLAMLRPRPESLTGTFLRRCLQSHGVEVQFAIEANGVTRYGLSHSAIKDIVIPIASADEQSAIVRFLDHTDRCIRTALARAEREILLLREYHTRLIADVVTGKLDVRQAAALLPDEQEPPAADEILPDEIDPDLDAEESDA